MWFSSHPTTGRRLRWRLLKDRADVAGALELVEARRAGDQQDAVPQLARRLALGGGGDDRAEEGDLLPLDRSRRVDDGRADIVADRLHAGVVAGPQGVVPGVAGGRVGERRVEAHLGQRLGVELLVE